MIGKIILWFGFGMFFPLFAATLLLGDYFTYFPLKPDPTRGLIVAFNYHGSYHYITRQLQNDFDWVWTLGWNAAVLIALGIFLTQDKFGKPKNSK